MKVLISLATVVVIGAGTASPILIGKNVEETLRANVERIDANPFYRASVESYESRYRDASAVISIGLDTAAITADMTPEERAAILPMLAALEDGIPFTLDIQHGPLLDSPTRSTGLVHVRIGIDGGIDLPPMLATALTHAAATDASLSFGFNGDGELLFNAPSFEAEEDGERLSLGGMQLLVNLGSWGRVYDARGSIGNTVLFDDNTGNSMALSPTTLAMQGDMRNGFVGGTGDFEFDVTGIEIVTPEDTVNVEHLTMNTSITSPSDERIDVVYQFGIARMTSEELRAPLEDLAFHFSIRDMDKAALQALADLYMSPNFFTQDPQVMQQALQAAMANTYGNAEFRLDSLAFTYGDGVFLNMSGTLRIDDSLFSNPAALQNPFAIMGAVDLDLDLAFSRGMADIAYEQFLRNQLDANDMSAQDLDQIIMLQRPQLGIMLGQLVQAGTLIAKQEGYEIAVSLNDGNLLINGAPGNLPFF